MLLPHRAGLAQVADVEMQVGGGGEEAKTAEVGDDGGGAWILPRQQRRSSHKRGERASAAAVRRGAASPTSSPIKKSVYAGFRKERHSPHRPNVHCAPAAGAPDGGDQGSGGALRAVGVPLRRSAGSLTGSQLALSLGAMAW